MYHLVLYSLFTGGILVICGCIIIYNGFIRNENNIKKSWVNIDVLLRQRRDEIPKLVKLCERYEYYERETLKKIIAAAAVALKATGPVNKAAKEKELSQVLNAVWSVGESYPNLKVDDNILQLQKRVSALEKNC